MTDILSRIASVFGVPKAFLRPGYAARRARLRRMHHLYWRRRVR